jgi:transcriptional regulator with XRE-family HTH domain
LNVARPENPVECTSTGELYRGSLIRELRRKKGLSLKRMAKLLGCDPDSLSKVETNGVNPSQQMLLKIAEVLETPLEYFTKAPVHPRILRKEGKQPDVYSRRMPPENKVAGTTPISKQPAVGQPTQKASSPSTRLNTPLPTPHKDILMHRLAVLRERVEAAEKNLRDTREEVLEIEALAVDIFGEEESHAPTPSTGSV